MPWNYIYIPDVNLGPRSCMYTSGMTLISGGYMRYIGVLNRIKANKRGVGNSNANNANIIADKRTAGNNLSNGRYFNFLIKVGVE